MAAGSPRTVSTMARVDYYDDPAAPRPNALVVAASVVVEDPDGRILLVQRADSEDWSLPGGAMELGESLTDCASREVHEETGLDIEIVGLVGIYSDPRHIIAYTDGEVRQQFNVCFHGAVLRGRLRHDAESIAIRYVSPTEVDRLPMTQSQRLRISHHLAGPSAPYLG